MVLNITPRAAVTAGELASTLNERERQMNATTTNNYYVERMNDADDFSVVDAQSHGHAAQQYINTTYPNRRMNAQRETGQPGKSGMFAIYEHVRGTVDTYRHVETVRVRLC